MANNSNKLANISQIIIILLSVVNLFQIIHAIDKNNNGTTQNHNGFSLKLIHRNRSNLRKMNATTRKEYIQLSKLRLKSLVTKSDNNKTKNDDDPIIRPPITLDHMLSMYAVEMEMGVFDPYPSYKTVYLLFDTGSDLIWTQCEGCTNCFHQTYPVYPASQSHTYRQLPCSNCPSDAQCVDNTCRLTTIHADDAKVEAILAYESFRFHSPTSTSLTLDDVLFGCGIDMQHFREDENPDNKISGIFGMGYGEHSFNQQKINLSKGKFQYCLQKHKNDDELPPMYLRFGDDIIQPSPPSSIPMFRYQNQPMYYIDLRGIRVDQKILDIDPSVFQIYPNGKGGTFIDSGSSDTLLTTSAYQILKNEVATQIEGANSNIERLSDEDAGFKGFGLCYKRVREPKTIMLPWVTWLFPNGVTFLVNPDVVFDMYTKHDGVNLCCLNVHEMTIEEGGMTVLGSDHQVDHRITFDIPNGQLLVANEDCNKGR